MANLECILHKVSITPCSKPKPNKTNNNKNTFKTRMNIYDIDRNNNTTQKRNISKQHSQGETINNNIYRKKYLFLFITPVSQKVQWLWE